MWCWKTQLIVSNSKHATCHFPFSVLSNRFVLLLNEKPRGRFSDADFFLHYIFLLCGKIWPTSLTPVKTTRTKKSVESCVMQKNSASEYPGMTFSLHYTPGFSCLLLLGTCEAPSPYPGKNHDCWCVCEVWGSLPLSRKKSRLASLFFKRY